MQIKSSKKMLLLELLEQLSPDSSKNTLRSWISMGRVRIEEKVAARANEYVEEGKLVTVDSKPKFLSHGLIIVYEVEDLVVINKPAGLLSVATDMETELTAHALLKRRFHNPNIYPIHRLDRETSGLLVFAYTTKARDGLKTQLEQRTMYREYEAVVHGYPGKGTWRCFLQENKRMEVFVSSPSKGKEAITHFETIKKRKKTSLLKLKLQTGRKHQIRVQAAHAGCPIVGDQKYGLPEDEGKDLQLQAIALSFVHPRTDTLLAFRKGACRNSELRGQKISF